MDESVMNDPRRQLAVSQPTQDGLGMPQGGSAAAPSAPPGVPPLLVLLHKGLRGRYALVIIAGLLIGVAAAALAWRLGRPVYQSDGFVRIAYSLPKVLAETDQNRPMAMFETFMQSQRMLITSRRVIDLAMREPVWKARQQRLPVAADQYFAERLVVETKPKSEFIRIIVTDTDPVLAATAVTAVVNAYSDLYEQEDKRLQNQITRILETTHKGVKDRVNELTRAMAKDHESSDLDRLYEAAWMNLNKVDAALFEVRLAISQQGVPTAATQPATQPATHPADGFASGEELSVEQIAAIDPIMRVYFEQQLRQEDDMMRLKSQGVGEAHHRYLQAKTELDITVARVERYANAFRKMYASGARRNGLSAAAGTSLVELRQTEANLEELRDDAVRRRDEIGEKKRLLKKLQDELVPAQKRLEELTALLEQRTTEALLGGRLQVISSGEIALSPVKDRRILWALGAGGVAACIPAGLVLLISLSRTRYRYSDETHADMTRTRVPLLGILPELGRSGPDDERAAAAAHSIHQLRVSLLAQSAGEPSRSYLVTSAVAGEGKTSLAMSLGISFAAAGLRTLVIDADMIGRRMTHGLEAQDVDGLHEALAHRSIRGRVRRGPGNVYLLFAGRASISHACTISPTAIRDLVEEARRYFEVVLVDTGPILGSLEAAVLAPEMDQVLLMVARGQQPRLMEAALRRLSSLGASVGGVVFNRARPEDFHRSPYGSSSMSSAREPGPVIDDERPKLYSRLGPLVEAVARSTPAGSAEQLIN